MVEVRDDFRDGFKEEDLFEWIMDLQGEVYREHKARSTFRIERGGKGYFIKVHRGAGSKEVFKNFSVANVPSGIECTRERPGYMRSIPQVPKMLTEF